VRIAVVDSSPLISLTHLDFAKHMPLFFDRVYVPRAVQRKVNSKRRFRHRLNKLYQTGFFTRCAAAGETNVQLLRAELDEGEAEALIQAQEKAALFFVSDEKRAREIAEAMGQKTSVPCADQRRGPLGRSRYRLNRCRRRSLAS
jgi:uncharacterized protein